MRLVEFPLLADENIHPEVTAHLKQSGVSVVTVWDEQLNGQSDVDILRRAHESGRVVLTHDSDFGTLAIAQEVPFTGIIFLRPGHIRAEFTIATINAIFERNIEIQPPFIIVAERQRSSVKIRVRQL
ncbi:MAG: hypothetical protein Kow0031_41490 [Anaerolineae bacterium]